MQGVGPDWSPLDKMSCDAVGAEMERWPQGWALLEILLRILLERLQCTGPRGTQMDTLANNNLKTDTTIWCFSTPPPVYSRAAWFLGLLLVSSSPPVCLCVHRGLSTYTFVRSRSTISRVSYTVLAKRKDETLTYHQPPTTYQSSFASNPARSEESHWGGQQHAPQDCQRASCCYTT